MNISFKPNTFRAVLAGSAMLATAATPVAHAQTDSTINNLSGDHVLTQTDIFGIQNPAVPGSSFCAPKGSKLRVVSDDGTTTSFRFVNVAATVNNPDTGCAANISVNTYTRYTMPSATLQTAPVRNSGVLLGGLLVPFKYNLSTKQINSSPTVAPFIGFRTGYQPFGLSFVPVVMLGMSITSGASNNSGANAALSAGVGLRMSSNKSENWHGGLLFGRDFNGNNAGATSGAYNWVSAFVGYSM